MVHANADKVSVLHWGKSFISMFSSVVTGLSSYYWRHFRFKRTDLYTGFYLKSCVYNAADTI